MKGEILMAQGEKPKQETVKPPPAKLVIIHENYDPSNDKK